MSNEQIESILSTKEGRVKSFKREMDWHVGSQFVRDLDALCKNDSCTDDENKIMALTEKSLYDKRCTIKWNIDTSKRGDFIHSNGYHMYSYGKIESWEYISDPALCQITTNWCGAW